MFLHDELFACLRKERSVAIFAALVLFLIVVLLCGVQGESGDSGSDFWRKGSEIGQRKKSFKFLQPRSRWTKM